MERGCLFALDAEGLAAWVGLHGRLGPADVEGALPLAAARLWSALLGGARPAVADVEALGARALAVRDGAVTIEAAVLRALLAGSSEADSGALDLARRACRMAQAEARPEEEFLAHLALARARRESGRPHLAVHVLSAFARGAPPAWHPWLAWELLLAGGEAQARTLFDQTVRPRLAAALVASPAARVASAGLDAVSAARGGDRAGFDVAAAILKQRPPAWPVVAAEAAAMVALIDVNAAAPSSEIAAFRTGDAVAVPLGLHGLGAPHDLPLEAEGTVAYVLALPGQPGRRLLRQGTGLLPAVRRLDQAPSDESGGMRTETALATLAISAPEGLAIEGFFAGVYGFAFHPVRHQEVVRLLIHRMRKRLGLDGTVVREGDGQADRVTLALAAPVLIPDGRCVLPSAERVLRALAALGETGASEAAAALQMPLRTVQRLLRQLVADGSCLAARDGLHINYRIEDTAFTSVVGLAAPGA
jgi:hypothetical protein